MTDSLSITSMSEDERDIQPIKRIKKNAKKDEMRVFLRIRPQDNIDPKGPIGVNEEERCLMGISQDEYLNQRIDEFRGLKFNKIFKEDCHQDKFYREVIAPILPDIFNNKKSSLIFAYGVTNSGKTHSIMGSKKSLNQNADGILPRVLQFLVEAKRQIKQQLSQKIDFDDDGPLTSNLFKMHEVLTIDGVQIDLNNFINSPHNQAVKLQDINILFENFEIYNEEIFDLQTMQISSQSQPMQFNNSHTNNLYTQSQNIDQRKEKRSASKHNTTQKNKLKIKEKYNKKVYIKDLVTNEIENNEQINWLIKNTIENRQVRNNNINQSSSRSQCCFKIRVKFTYCNAFHSLEEEASLLILDLAGAERAKKTHNTGSKMTESCHINKTLLCLGNCIRSLRNGDETIPYRESKLTRILNEYFIDQNNVLMIVHLHPGLSYTEENINVLKYAAIGLEAKLKAAAPIQEGNSKYSFLMDSAQKSMRHDKSYMSNISYDQRNNYYRDNQSMDQNQIFDQIDNIMNTNYLLQSDSKTQGQGQQRSTQYYANQNEGAQLFDHATMNYESNMSRALQEKQKQLEEKYREIEMKEVIQMQKRAIENFDMQFESLINEEQSKLKLGQSLFNQFRIPDQIMYGDMTEEEVNQQQIQSINQQSQDDKENHSKKSIIRLSSSKIKRYSDISSQQSAQKITQIGGGYSKQSPEISQSQEQSKRYPSYSQQTQVQNLRTLLQNEKFLILNQKPPFKNEKSPQQIEQQSEKYSLSSQKSQQQCQKQKQQQQSNQNQQQSKENEEEQNEYNSVEKNEQLSIDRKENDKFYIRDKNSTNSLRINQEDMAIINSKDRSRQVSNNSYQPISQSPSYNHNNSHIKNQSQDDEDNNDDKSSLLIQMSQSQKTIHDPKKSDIITLDSQIQQQRKHIHSPHQYIQSMGNSQQLINQSSQNRIKQVQSNHKMMDVEYENLNANENVNANEKGNSSNFKREMIEEIEKSTSEISSKKKKKLEMKANVKEYLEDLYERSSLKVKSEIMIDEMDQSNNQLLESLNINEQTYDSESEHNKTAPNSINSIADFNILQRSPSLDVLSISQQLIQLKIKQEQDRINLQKNLDNGEEILKKQLIFDGSEEQQLKKQIMNQSQKLMNLLKEKEEEMALQKKYLEIQQDNKHKEDERKMKQFEDWINQIQQELRVQQRFLEQKEIILSQQQMELATLQTNLQDKYRIQQEQIQENLLESQQMKEKITIQEQKLREETERIDKLQTKLQEEMSMLIKEKSLLGIQKGKSEVMKSLQVTPHKEIQKIPQPSSNTMEAEVVNDLHPHHVNFDLSNIPISKQQMEVEERGGLSTPRRISGSYYPGHQPHSSLTKVHDHSRKFAEKQIQTSAYKSQKGSQNNSSIIINNSNNANNLNNNANNANNTNNTNNANMNNNSSNNGQPLQHSDASVYTYYTYSEAEQLPLTQNNLTQFNYSSNTGSTSNSQTSNNNINTSTKNKSKNGQILSKQKNTSKTVQSPSNGQSNLSQSISIKLSNQVFSNSQNMLHIQESKEEDLAKSNTKHTLSIKTDLPNQQQLDQDFEIAQDNQELMIEEKPLSKQQQKEEEEDEENENEQESKRQRGKKKNNKQKKPKKATSKERKNSTSIDSSIMQACEECNHIIMSTDSNDDSSQLNESDKEQKVERRRGRSQDKSDRQSDFRQKTAKCHLCTSRHSIVSVDSDTSSTVSSKSTKNKKPKAKNQKSKSQQNISEEEDIESASNISNTSKNPKAAKKKTKNKK